MAQDTGGVEAAGKWITAANPTHTSLIDAENKLTRLYSFVNVPQAVWINEEGKLVRPPETAFIDDKFKSFSHFDAKPYLDALRDWVDKGDKSQYAMSESELKSLLTPASADHEKAAVEFHLGEYLVHTGNKPDAIPHFIAAQKLYPDNWNYKRQAWALTSVKDYNTTFKQELDAAGKPFYEAPHIATDPKKKD